MVLLYFVIVIHCNLCDGKKVEVLVSDLVFLKKLESRYPIVGERIELMHELAVPTEERRKI